MSSDDLPQARSARVDVLHDGYAGEQGVAPTIGLVREGEHIIVIDPGMVANHSRILDPLRALGVAPGDVTDVVISHWHPDHTLNVALFPAARVHDCWATYHRDQWESREADRVALTASVRLLAIPGHTPQDISTVVGTADSVIVFTHLWWDAASEGDPVATDLGALHRGRDRVLRLADRIVPGHGPAFTPDDATPR